MRQQGWNVGRTRLKIHGDHGDQHQNRTQQSVQEEFERCIDTVHPAPDPDDQEHWNKPCFKEQIEEDHI